MRMLLIVTSAIVLTACSMPVAASARGEGPLVAAQAERKTATELRLQLSASGYEKLQAAMRWEAKPMRHDLYFEAFDGSRFRLREAGLQFRIKAKGKKTEWQLSSVVERRVVTSGNLPVGINTTWAEEGKLSAAERDRFAALTGRYFMLEDRGGAAMREVGAEVDAAWRSLPWPGLAHVPAGTRLVPAATKRHQAFEAPLATEVGPLTMMIARDTVRDEAGRAVTLYEVEAEPDFEADAAQMEAAARAFGEALAKLGLKPADVGPSKPDIFAYTLKQLTRP